jgi:preprotein translocase subunit SecD
MSTRNKVILIMALAAVAALLAFPKEDYLLHKLGLKKAHLQVKEGLDLKGGAHLVYQADLSKIGGTDKNSAMQSLVKVVQQRVNPGGTSEINVQQAGSDRVLVELPGVKDVTQAQEIIGKTAQLTFLEIDPKTQLPTDTGISGKDVQKATADFDPQSGQPIVSLQLKSGDATKRFGDLTTRLNQTGSQMATLLDQEIIFGPATVSSPITDGRAQLSGNFDVKQAKQIAQLINAGALPVPINLVEQRTVGPTLGQESVQRSLVAGIIGLAVVAFFMLAYYRLAGLVAVIALGIYTCLTLTLYKLSAFTPYTIVLTLAGIAGFILSIGMAVDANILIFERMKEELRAGKSFVAAVEAGFDRAWSSIRDSNVSTLITCAILYIFSGSIPIIRGFAVTLGLGVLVSMFTAVVVSRTLLRGIIATKHGRDPKWYGLTGEVSQ